MINKKKYRNKPLYKKFNSLRINIQNRQKLLKFKKKKWNFLLKRIRLTDKLAKLRLRSNKRLANFRKQNCFYKFFDQGAYRIPRFANFFSKTFKQSVETNKSFKLFYGSMGKKYLKSLSKKSKNLSNRYNNKINSTIFFTNILESRLDVSLLRSHFVLSIMNARQLITHGHVFVNSKKITKASFHLRKGDLVTFSTKSHKLIEYYIANSKAWPLPPYYFQVSYKIFQILVIEDIKLLNMSMNFDTPLNLQNVLKSYHK